LLQAYFHLATQEAAVARIAAQKDRNAGARGTASIGAPLHDGDEVRITLSADGLAVDEPDQRLAWHGEPVAADFDVTFPAVPERSDYTLKIRAELNGAPVGTLKLRVAVTASAKARRGFVGGAAPARGAFHAYEYIFLSYASEDRARVLDVAQALDRLGVPFFQDVLSLRAGDDWETRIQAILPICDGFMLFWSKAAAASQWVMREAQMALALRRENADSGPDILPFILDQPPPHAPEALKAIHLNDPISCVRAALLR
jgi:hypothetical protein